MDICINLPALRKLDAMLLASADNPSSQLPFSFALEHKNSKELSFQCVFWIKISNMCFFCPGVATCFYFQED